MKKIFSIILLTLILSACSNSVRYGVVSTKKFDINSPSLTQGKNVSYYYEVNLGEKVGEDSVKGTTDSVIKASLAKNKCVVAFNNANIHKVTRFTSIEIEFKGEEIIDRSIPGCK